MINVNLDGKLQKKMEIALKSQNAVFIGTTLRQVAKRLFHQQQAELAREISKFALQFLQETTSLYALIIRDLYFFNYGVWLDKEEVTQLPPNSIDTTPNAEICQNFNKIFQLSCF